jgi:hypothetical protein
MHSQIALQGVNEGLHLANEQTQEGSDLGPSLHGIGRTLTLTVPNGYLNRNVNRMNCEVWIRLTGLYEADYCVLLDWFGVDPSHLRSDTRSAQIGDIDLGYSRCCYLKQPMLVGIGEVSDKRQQGRQYGVLPSIGLERFNQVNKTLFEPSKPSLGGFPKLLGRIDEMVQGGADIRQAISDDHCPSSGVGLGSDTKKCYPYSCRLTATFREGLISATVEPLGDFSLDSVEMFFSPV